MGHFSARRWWTLPWRTSLAPQEDDPGERAPGEAPQEGAGPEEDPVEVLSQAASDSIDRLNRAIRISEDDREDLKTPWPEPGESWRQNKTMDS